MDLSQVSIHKVPSEQRFWVIRAESGHYHAHFREAGVVAIGHLDILKLKESGDGVFTPDIENLQESLVRKIPEDDRTSYNISSTINQVTRFTNDISIGDIVVTPGPEGRAISFGRIIGQPRIDKEQVFAASSETSEITPMRFSLRRKVAWGPLVRRVQFPMGVKRSLGANQTVFNVDKHWRALHHLIYPVFSKEETNYFSLKIDQHEKINAYSIAKITSLLTQAEALGSFGKDLNKWDREVFLDKFHDFISADETALGIQAQFMSPGDANFSLGGPHTDRALATAIIVLLVYTILTGNDRFGIEPLLEQEGVIDAFQGFIGQMWFDDGGQKIQDNLKLKLPDYNTVPLEDSTNDEFIEVA